MLTRKRLRRGSIFDLVIMFASENIVPIRVCDSMLLCVDSIEQMNRNISDARTIYDFRCEWYCLMHSTEEHITLAAFLMA